MCVGRHRERRKTNIDRYAVWMANERELKKSRFVEKGRSRNETGNFRGTCTVNDQ